MNNHEYALLRKQDNILLVTHWRPDGDTPAPLSTMH